VRANGGGDRALAWVAARQLTVITTSQLHAAGLSRDAIATRRARGLLRRRHRGVYFVGAGPAPPGAIELAALFACGPSSVISHRSAAALWGLTAADADVEAVAVTVVKPACRPRNGLHVHRTQHLHPRDRTTHHGIRVTAPSRTLIDFAGQATADELESAVSEAFALRLVTEPKLQAAMARTPRRAGVAALRTLLGATGGPVVTRSRAERLRRLIKAARLPQPLFNAPLHGYTADVLWPDRRLVVEFDGYDFHGHRLAFERDRRRDAALVAAGYRVIRVTWHQLTKEPFAVVATIARALGAWSPDRPQSYDQLDDARPPDQRRRD
jgi:very-short-patch-repair endonuclease